MPASITAHKDTKVGDWFRANTDHRLRTDYMEIVGMDWDQGANDAILQVRNESTGTIHTTPYESWRPHMRPTTPPWAD